MEVACDRSLSYTLVYEVIKEACRVGVQEFCLGSGTRNMPFLAALKAQVGVKLHFWYEERSCAFFALGRSRQSGRPVAVITTSGTAAGELLPAAMEAHYSATPILLITADRPKVLRGTGAPQAAEQANLFGVYAKHAQDLDSLGDCDLKAWDQQGAAHLNVCLDEPLPDTFLEFDDLKIHEPPLMHGSSLKKTSDALDLFLSPLTQPFVIVGDLPDEARDPVKHFLLQLKAPVFLEGLSGLREDPALQALRVFRTDGLFSFFEERSYQVDGVLRIGGMPTFRFWRDLEHHLEIEVFSISQQPFSGLSLSSVHTERLALFFDQYIPKKVFQPLGNDRFPQELRTLLTNEPHSEPGVVYELSRKIPKGSRIYLGNSMPIREWDLAATSQMKGFTLNASRGLNGIDGQLSTFFGLCEKGKENWGIFGDLTTLYDLAAPWILPTLEDMCIRIVVINNSGGKIFSRLFSHVEMQNQHCLNFSHLAAHWNLPYYSHEAYLKERLMDPICLIELKPDLVSSERFWKKYSAL